MLLESIVKKSLLQIYEAKQAKGSVAKQIDEFSAIHEQITKLKSELKSLESDPKYKEGKERIGAIMEELKATGETVMETKKYVVSITRSGSESESVKYAEVLKEFLPQVSVRLRQVYESLKSAHTSVKKTSPSIDVAKKEVKESASSVSSVLSKVASGLKSVRSAMNRIKSKIK